MTRMTYCMTSLISFGDSDQIFLLSLIWCWVLLRIVWTKVEMILLLKFLFCD